MIMIIIKVGVENNELIRWVINEGNIANYLMTMWYVVNMWLVKVPDAIIMIVISLISIVKCFLSRFNDSL